MSRSPEEIRRSLESNRAELGLAVQRLKGEIEVATDWRRHLREHQQQAMVGAAVAGFVIGGGLAAVSGLLFRRRR